MEVLDSGIARANMPDQQPVNESDVELSGGLCDIGTVEKEAYCVEWSLTSCWCLETPLDAQLVFCTRVVRCSFSILWPDPSIAL